MKIAVIGAGNVGGTLGTCWAKIGHEIVFGVRNPGDSKVQKVLKSTAGKAEAKSVPEAVKDAAVVVLATPWEAAEDAIRSAGNLSGKIVIDTTNPLFLGAEGLRKGLVIGHSTSAAEQIAGWAAGAHVVKAFNTIGAKNMANPKIGSQAATMFVCGDDAKAKSTALKLAEELGFEAVDAGMLSIARLLEPLAMLWIHMAYGMGWGPDFGFKAIRRNA